MPWAEAVHGVIAELTVVAAAIFCTPSTWTPRAGVPLIPFSYDTGSEAYVVIYREWNSLIQETLKVQPQSSEQPSDYGTLVGSRLCEILIGYTGGLNSGIVA